MSHKRRSPCCADEARRFLESDGVSRSEPDTGPLPDDELDDLRDHFVNGSGAYTDSALVGRLVKEIDRLRVSRSEPDTGLREIVEFVADWAHDCSPSNAATPWDRQHPDEIDPAAYGFDDIEERCRAALSESSASEPPPRCVHGTPCRERDCPEYGRALRAPSRSEPDTGLDAPRLEAAFTKAVNAPSATGRGIAVPYWRDVERIWQVVHAALAGRGLDTKEEDAFYKGGKWHRRTVELLSLLDDAVKVQRTPCDHKGIGLPGCVTCDPRIRNEIGIAYSAAPSSAALTAPEER